MQKNKKGPSRIKKWLFGSIRIKISAFVVLLCLILVSLFWILSIQMLQPSYQDLIRNDLQSTLNTVVDILNTAQADGVALLHTTVENGVTHTDISDEVLVLLRKAQEDGTLDLTGRCLDISDSQMRNLLLSDQLELRCLLHQSHEVGITPDGILFSPERNGALVTVIRSHLRDEGQYEQVVEGGQIVLGSTAANGQFLILVSANLERIPQAVNVLNQLLVPISIFLIVLSVGCAWAFSSWFSRPINRLSNATRKMAAGNYDVAVRIDSYDEIGTLSANFNTMAQEVKRSTEMQKEFFANVSHDLRTPLTLIKGYAETLRDLTGDDAKKRNEQLTVIVDESDRLSKLVNSVMEYSRISSGIEKPKVEPFNISRLYHDIGARYATFCQQKGLLFDYLGEDNCYANADAAQMERALHNLLGNAINHVGPDGYAGLHFGKTDKNNFRVEIIDHGPGIPAEDLPHIFDRYYRSRSDAGKTGTGLGLAITKAIFAGNKCTFGVESELGKGSTFWFEIPIIDPTDEDLLRESEAAEGEGAEYSMDFPIGALPEMPGREGTAGETAAENDALQGGQENGIFIGETNPVRFNLYQMCDEVGYDYEVACQQSGGQFVFEADGDHDVTADPGQIQRVLQILLDNARQHLGPDGFMGLYLKQLEEGRVRVSVVDHGPGIPEREIPLLFDCYDRSHAGTGQTGTGFGLTIAKAIFEANGCTYGVESEEGEGAVFWFELAVDGAAGQAARRDEAELAEPVAPAEDAVRENPAYVTFNLYQMCDEVSYDSEAFCAESGKQFVLAGDEEVAIEADPVQMEELLRILLQLGRNHIGADGQLGMRVSKTPQNRARVEVSHHAPNIPENRMGTLFDNDDEAVNLPRAKAIFEENGYLYGIQAGEAIGTLFWFEIPLPGEAPLPPGAQGDTDGDTE